MRVRLRLLMLSALLAAACSEAPLEFAEPWDRPIAEYLAEGGFDVLSSTDVIVDDEYVARQYLLDASSRCPTQERGCVVDGLRLATGVDALESFGPGVEFETTRGDRPCLGRMVRLGSADVPAVEGFVIDELDIGSLWSLDLDCVVGSLG